MRFCIKQAILMLLAGMMAESKLQEEDENGTD